jgi:hypothetical protein
MRFPVRSCLFGAAAFFLILGSAGAASPDNGLITAFTVENVSAFLTASGGTDLKTDKDEAGNPVIASRLPDGPIVTTLVDCEGTPTCDGVQFAMYFERNESINIDVANEYNLAFLDATALIEKDGSLTLATFVRAKGGIMRENLAEYFTHFIAAPAGLAAVLKNRMQVSYTPSKAKARPARVQQGYALRRIEPPSKAN